MTELADPGQEFLDSDPTVLRPPPPAQFAPYPVPNPRVRVATEIGAGVIVAATLVRHQLAAQQPQVGQTTAQANQAWAAAAPKWMQLTLPAIRQAYQLGRVEGLTPAELDALAGAYTRAVGDYLGTTSAEALTAGFEAQLAQRWSADLAWHRATAAYGLDRQQMRSYVAALIGGDKMPATPGSGLLPTAARLVVDRLLMARASRIGDNEAASATQAGQRMSWLWLARNNRLDPGARVEWDNVEGACAVCTALHRQAVGLDEPFVLPSGEKVWAPAAHPGCHCQLRLLRAISKAYDQSEPRDGGGRWAKVGQKTRTDTADWLERQKQPPADEDETPFGHAAKPTFGAKPLFGHGQSSPFGSSPFGADSGGPFGRSPFGTAEAKRAAAALAGEDGAASPFARRVPRKTVVLRRRTTLVGRPPVTDPAGGSPSYYYLDADRYNSLTEFNDIGSRYGEDEDVDFGNTVRGDPVGALRYGPGPKSAWSAVSPEHHLDEFRIAPSLDTPAAHQLWAQINALVPDCREKALDDAGRITARFKDSDWAQIQKLSGDAMIGPATAHSAVLRQARAWQIGALAPGEDDSLLAAYVDYCLWVKPEQTLGPVGLRMENELNFAESEGLHPRADDYAGRPLVVDQVFRFTPNRLTPDAEHSNVSVRTSGRYSVAWHTYRSAALDFAGEDLPFLYTGLEVLQMEPPDRSGRNV